MELNGKVKIILFPCLHDFFHRSPFYLAVYCRSVDNTRTACETRPPLPPWTGADLGEGGGRGGGDVQLFGKKIPEALRVITLLFTVKIKTIADFLFQIGHRFD